MSLLQELIPEFFSLPEMFMNNNSYNFGKTDEGLVVGDVLLPKWAKSPEDFVRINRMVRYNLCNEMQHKASSCFYYSKYIRLKKILMSAKHFRIGLYINKKTSYGRFLKLIVLLNFYFLCKMVFTLQYSYV